MKDVHVARGGEIVGKFDYSQFLSGGFNPRYFMASGPVESDCHWWVQGMAGWVSLKERMPNPVRDLADDSDAVRVTPSEDSIPDLVAISRAGRVSGIMESGWLIFCSVGSFTTVRIDDSFWCEQRKSWVPVSEAYDKKIKPFSSSVMPSGNFDEPWPVVFRESQPVWAGPPALISDRIKSGELKDSDVIAFNTSEPMVSLRLWLKDNEKDQGWRTPPSYVPGGWREHPATEKQLSLLAEYGLEVPPNITKGQASAWIDKLFNSPEAQEARGDKILESIINEEVDLAERGLGCAGHRTPSGAYRAEINRNFEEADESGVDSDAVYALQSARVNYWLHVFDPDEESASIKVDDEGVDMGFEFFANDQKLWHELRMLAKNYRSRPSKVQVINTLRALDAASGDWDDSRPESFFDQLKIASS
jgi:hypothetical protein